MWMFTSLENFGFWIGTLSEKGLGAAGDKVAKDVIPAGRPMDVIKARHRMSRDMAELHSLHTRLYNYHTTAEEMCHNLCRKVVREALSLPQDELENPRAKASYKLCLQLLSYEKYFPLPEIDWSRHFSMGELWELIKTAKLHLAFYEKRERQQEITERLKLFVKNLLPKLPMGDVEEALGFVPVYALHEDTADKLDGFIRFAVQTGKEDSLFHRLGETLFKNVLITSGIDPQYMDESTTMPVMPKDAK